MLEEIRCAAALGLTSSTAARGRRLFTLAPAGRVLAPPCRFATAQNHANAARLFVCYAVRVKVPGKLAVVKLVGLVSIDTEARFGCRRGLSRRKDCQQAGVPVILISTAD
ncbi:hypothetical protein DR62_06965 [Burkholderia thailandensis]|nr:hypothetical protein DR62_06965 [Burkholderia thailandensis]AOI51215.1 hypothetical protein WI24_04950 [Burkholderia thailandensis]